VEGRHDATWAVLRAHDLDHKDAEDPEHPGIVVDTPERREIAQFSPALEPNRGPKATSMPRPWWAMWDIFESRQDALATARPGHPYASIFWAVAYREVLPYVERLVDADLERGELGRAVLDVALSSMLHAELGDLAAAERARSTVTQRLRVVLQRIAVQHPGLADHLAAHVRTGTFCAYQSDPERPVVWDLGPSGRR